VLYPLTGMGHAICVYRHAGKYFAWDSVVGTVEISAPWTAPTLGWTWHRAWGQRVGMGMFGYALFIGEGEDG
jgi:hypothetical protein